MDLYGPMRVASINGKRYILVVDDYSRFTRVRFLKTKYEAPAAIIKCIKNIQVRLKATVRNVRTDNGTEFVNQTLREWYENVGITHQTSVARTPQQNGVIERRNWTLVEAARTMLIFSSAPLFLWAEAINTACYTQNPMASDDWDRLFQPMFDEYFNPPPIAVSPVQEAPALRVEVLADSPMSTLIDQDAPSTSILTLQEHSSIIFQVEPKNFKQAMTEPSWIDAMQEEIHEFERLEVWELVPCPDKVFLIKLGMKSMSPETLKRLAEETDE
ncbi:retrovirus-related pol polyprotein from transposon TNT 1-94 [Tanacetum coccineum]